MELGLAGRVAVITGGGTGIGREAAFLFAREGVRVTITGRRLEPLAEVAKEAEAQGLSIHPFAADVRDTEAMRRCAAETVARFGSLDIWVNNAGIARTKPFFELTEQDWDDVMDVNLKATFFCTRIAAEQMAAQKSGGVILNASSYAIRIPHAGGAPYAAAKTGVSCLTRTLAAELAPYHIRVVGYIPGMIATEISRKTIEKRKDELVAAAALRRLGQPADIAGPLVFLASDVCSYITGVDVEISGGKYCVQNTQFAYDAAEGRITGLQS